MLLHGAALWPHAAWAWARTRDGSDDPLGTVAVGALVVLAGCHVSRARCAPRVAWLLAAVGLLVAATVARFWTTPLPAATLAMLSWGAGAAAWAPAGAARLPLLGLSILSVPLISSLQFYAGYPLRVLTAEASAWLLRLLGFAAERTGASMLVDGRLVMVDAPCSGVQLAWMGYFTACVTAALARSTDRSVLARLPLVGVLVLTGNLLRNSVLVVLETRPGGASPMLHEGVGLLVLACVCAGVVRWMRGMRAAKARIDDIDPSNARVGVRPSMLVVLGCALVPLATFVPISSATIAAPRGAVEWPTRWQGRELRPMALSAVEQRFADRFPGHIARFHTDAGEIVLRDVREPTRLLHPASDCYRGAGYGVSAMRLERRDASRELWRCFTAAGEGRTTRVCERIVDAAGASFTDTSAWYWSALLGRSTGPWLAVTQATAQ